MFSALLGMTSRACKPHTAPRTLLFQHQIHPLPWHCSGWGWAHADQRAGVASCSSCKQLMPFPRGLVRGWKLIRSPAGEASGWEVPGTLRLGSLAASRVTRLPGFTSPDPTQGHWCCSETDTLSPSAQSPQQGPFQGSREKRTVRKQQFAMLGSEKNHQWMWEPAQDAIPVCSGRGPQPSTNSPLWLQW